MEDEEIVKSVLLMALQNQQGVEVGSVMVISMTPVRQETQERVRSGLSKKLINKNSYYNKQARIRKEMQGHGFYGLKNHISDPQLL